MTTEQQEEPTKQDPPETAQDPTPAKPKAAATEYHILKLLHSQGADETYSVHARNVKAVGAQDALRRTVTPTEEKQSFLAVPSRSMKLHTVSLLTKQQTVIE